MSIQSEQCPGSGHQKQTSGDFGYMRKSVNPDRGWYESVLPTWTYHQIPTVTIGAIRFARALPVPHDPMIQVGDLVLPMKL